MYVYIKSESSLYTVGFYDPQGKWHPENDYTNPGDAASRVHYLNGGREQEPDPALAQHRWIREQQGPG